MIELNPIKVVKGWISEYLNLPILLENTVYRKELKQYENGVIESIKRAVHVKLSIQGNLEVTSIWPGNQSLERFTLPRSNFQRLKNDVKYAVREFSDFYRNTI